MEEKLERLIKLLIAKNLKAVSIGKAKNIDIANRTCDIELAPELTLFQCRLNAIIDTYDNHIVVVPKEGSLVAFTTIENQDTNAMVIACSDIEQVIVTVGKSKVEIKEDKIVLNDGKNGLVKIVDLVKKINNIENLLNSHTHPYMNVNISATTSSIISGTGIVPTTKKSDLEDTKILHS